MRVAVIGSRSLQLSALEEFLPEYQKYGRAAPLRRNITIIEHTDLVLAFWDGSSKGTAFVIEQCRKRNIPCQVIDLVP